MPISVTIGTSTLHVADWLDIVGKAAPIVGLIVAILSGLTAYRSFLANGRASRQAHMHALFREYLKLWIERQEPGNKPSEKDERFVAFKLYALEEVFLWRKTEKSLARNWLTPSEAKISKSELNAWEATIAEHLRYDPNLTRPALRDYRSCYGNQFYKWAMIILGEQDF